jgi:TrmH family RNA methyltransferase
MPTLITSPHNPRLSRVQGLLEQRKQRQSEQAFVVEGVRLTEEALASGWQPELTLFSARLSERGMQVVRGLEQRGGEVLEIPERLMDKLAATETSQGLLAVFPMPRPALPEALDFALIVDTLRDPGNLGTLLRSAAAAGVQAVLLSPGTTDAFAPKVLRAGMGAHFRLPVLHASWGEIRAICKERATPLHILLAEADQGTACWDLDLRQPLALMVGNEAEGASPDAQRITDQPVTIPMPGRSESLNAAAAASVLLFEVVRQRRDP